MLRPLVLCLVLLAAAVLPTAAARVDTCDKYGVCPIVRVEPDPLLVCAGLGFGLQGVAACVQERWDGATCVRVIVGFHGWNSCDLTDRIAVSDDGLLP